MMEKHPFLNTYVNNLNMNDTVLAIEKMLSDGSNHYVVPVNVDVIVKMENDAYLKKIVDCADLVLVDGQPLIWISKLYRCPVKEKISGSDMVPIMCKKAEEKGYKVFIIGGKSGVAEKARQNLEHIYPKIQVAGTYAPPFGFEKDPNAIDRINHVLKEADPDILIACFGCPKQEKWIYENYRKYNAKVSICAGATVDFLAGSVKRAPKWMSNHGLEWFYRFLKEPKRMFKRYFIDDMKIIRLVWKYR